MKRIFILFIVAGLIGIGHGVSSADIFMKGPVWYNESCNAYSYGDIKQISVSGNYIGVATECACSVDKAEACNGVFIFELDVRNVSNAPSPFVYSTNGWVESVHVDGNRAAAGSSDNNIYYFEVNEYKNWQKKWNKNLGTTVDSVYVSGNYVAGGSGNHVYLFDTDGNEKWKYDVNSKINVITIVDNKVAAGTRDGYVYIFDVSGNIIKNIKTNAAVESIYAADGVIAVGSDQIYVFGSNGVEKWKSETKGVIKSVHFADGTLVAGSLNNIVYIFDITDVNNIKKKAEYLAGSGIWSVHVSGNYVAAGSTDGTIYLIETNGELKWKYKAGISKTARSSAVCSIYNTEDYVYAGGWGKAVYLFGSSMVIADDEIKQADRLIMYVKGEMNTSAEEAVLQKAEDELEAGNYASAREIPKGVKPMIDEHINNRISEMENILNKINATVDTQKYTALSTELKKEYDDIEKARDLLSQERYVESIRIVKNPGVKIKAEISKIIGNYEQTVEKVTTWNEKKIESLLAQESEYSKMSKEETEAEIKLAGEIELDFSDAENNIGLAKKKLAENDYEAAIKLSEEAIELVEKTINEDIADAEDEIDEVGKTLLIFKVDPSYANNIILKRLMIDTSYAKKDLNVSRTRLMHEKCGARYELDCPDYSASMFWIGHARGVISKDEAFAAYRVIAYVIIILLILFIVVRLYLGKKKEAAEETTEEGEKENIEKNE